MAAQIGAVDDMLRLISGCGLMICGYMTHGSRHGSMAGSTHGCSSSAALNYIENVLLQQLFDIQTSPVL